MDINFCTDRGGTGRGLNNNIGGNGTVANANAISVTESSQSG